MTDKPNNLNLDDRLRFNAEHGDKQSQYELGFKYFTDADIKGHYQSYAAAAYWFRKAAEQDHSPSQRWLGYMLIRGLGVDCEHEEGKLWLKLACKNGCAMACLVLAKCLIKYDLDFEHANHYLAQSTEPEAYWMLGNSYMQGWGIEKDTQKAVELYIQAAESGDPYILESLKSHIALDTIPESMRDRLFIAMLYGKSDNIEDFENDGELA